MAERERATDGALLHEAGERSFTAEWEESTTAGVLLLLPYLVDLHLDETEQAILTGKYWEGVGYVTLATRLGLDIDTVRRTHRRALRKLRRHVEKAVADDA